MSGAAGPRALTLIEILIAVGLLVALAALTMPSMVERLNDRAFDAGGDSLQRHLVLARAHARRVGAPVEIVYEVAEHRLVARPFDLLHPIDDAGEPPDDLLAEDAQEVALEPLREAWSVRELPARVRLASAAHDAEEDAPVAARLRVAIFLADGSALAADPLLLTDDDGRRARVVLNPLTGTVTLDEGSEEVITTEEEPIEAEEEPIGTEEEPIEAEEPDA